MGGKGSGPKPGNKPGPGRTAWVEPEEKKVKYSTRIKAKWREWLRQQKNASEELDKALEKHIKRHGGLELGEFKIWRMGYYNLWIQHASGEGMEVSEKTLEKVIGDFFGENF